MSRKKILILVIAFTAVIIFLLIVLNSRHRLSSISVSKDKWDSIKNSKSESLNIKLEDIEFNDYKLIIDEKNNTLYYSAVNDSKNKYDPLVSFNANNKNIKLVFLSDEITDEKIKSNYEFKIMIYNENVYHIYNLVCTDLPILNIRYMEETQNTGKTIPIEVYLFNNLSNTPNKITVSDGKLKINDENYTFSLHKLTPGKNKRDNKISILNMKPDSEYILTKVENGNDFSGGIQRVELFINNEYKGVYSLRYIDEKPKMKNE